MNFKRLFFALMAISVVFAGCKEKEDLGSPRMEVSPAELTFTQGDGTQTVDLLSTRDWKVKSAPDWAALSVQEGKASTKPLNITVTVLANSGYNRSGSIVFSCGLRKCALAIKQDGARGELKKGSGTKADPYSVWGVDEYLNELGSGVVSPNAVFVKGIISKLASKDGEFSADFGNATFFISDDGVFYGTDEKNIDQDRDFYAYRVKFLGNRKWTAKDTQIKVGDEVVLYGKVVLYKGNTPETDFQSGPFLYSLNGKDEGGASDPQTEITSSTIANFIAKADGNTYYRLTGTVSAFETKTSNGNNYMDFKLTDDTGTILVYSFVDGQYDKWSAKIKNGGTAVVTGTYKLFNSTHEVVNATVESFDENGTPVQTESGTVTEMIAVTDGTSVVINDALVVAKSTIGMVVTDGSSNAYLYFGDAAPSNVNIGDKVKVEATKATYGGVPEFTSPKLTVISSGNAVNYPDAKDITSSAVSYAPTVTEYIKLSGTLAISGKYYNVVIAGTDARQGSISSPLESLGVANYDGQEITVTGYCNGVSSGKYINIIAVEVTPANPDAKRCTVSPDKLNVAADATSATLAITANAAWTVSSDNADVTVSPTSGDSNATVTLSFPANTGDAPRTANIRVVCAEANVDVTVPFTQAKPASGNQTKISIDFTQEIEGFPQAKGTKDGTFTISGYEFVFHAADDFYQFKYNNALAMLIGKANSYIKLPVMEGKALVGIEFLTGDNASEKVVVDVAKEDGTRLNVNTATLKKATEYKWTVPGDVGVRYEVLVANANNAQFKYLTLSYE